ncbi:hypothetical protein [Fodinicola feengrottensis]|uniref:Uncharacterized protein n=1 Tax=Fodinicola feengrottensis TaxID=435914 RepID=A0ABN2IIV3_9ACTN|nr:hypothetical protein [Fodinicola feengrottensis]
MSSAASGFGCGVLIGVWDTNGHPDPPPAGRITVTYPASGGKTVWAELQIEPPAGPDRWLPKRTLLRPPPGTTPALLPPYNYNTLQRLLDGLVGSAPSMSAAKSHDAP